MNAHNEQPDPASPVVKQNLTTQPAAAQLGDRLDRAYAERNALAIAFAKAALAAGWRAGRGYDDDQSKDWAPQWRHVVYVDLVACVERIEEAIEHRVPHDIYGTVQVELAEIRRLAHAGTPKTGSEAREAVLAELVEAISAFKGKRGAFMALGAQDERTVRLWWALANAQAGDAEVQP